MGIPERKVAVLVIERKDGKWWATSGSIELATGYFLDGEIVVLNYYCEDTLLGIIKDLVNLAKDGGF